MHGDNAFYEKYAGYQSQKLIMVYFFLEHVHDISSGEITNSVSLAIITSFNLENGRS